VGLLVSSLSTNQISSYIFCGVILLALTLADQVGTVVTLPVWLSSVLNWLSFGFHYDSFSKGIFDSRDAAYYILVSGLLLFLNAQVLIRRKWS